MGNKKLCLLALVFLLFLTGCSYKVGEIDEQSLKTLLQSHNNDDKSEDYYVRADSMLSVALPQSHTSIFINQLGYGVNDRKRAIFSGDKIGSRFNVVNTASGTVVYNGEITDEGGIKMGDFSSVTKAGRYYIETDVIGRSYYFNISDNVYDDLFPQLLNGFFADGDSVPDNKEGVLDACFGMDCVIYGMQCNGDVFGVESNIVQELLNMSDALLSMQSEDGSILDDYEATAAFCGIISMCGNEFGKYEETMEGTCKESANAAWKWLEGKPCDTEVKEEARFYAAAHLYGLYKTTTYKTISEDFLNSRESGYGEDSFGFYGSIAYMNSKAEVDRSLCTYIMTDMIEQADGICDNVTADKVYKVGTTEFDTAMDNTARISFINYLVPSSEYIDILTCAVEYIGGYNPSGENHLENMPEGRKYEYRGIMIYAVSNILTGIE
jgi:hypothetical protein